MKRLETGRSRGFGYVTFHKMVHAAAAVREMNGVDLEGRAVLVQEAVGQAVAT